MPNLPDARLRFLAEVTGTVLGAGPLEEQARRLAAQLRQFLGIDASVIHLVDGAELVLLASTGFDERRLSPRLPVAYGVAGEVLKARRPVAIADVRCHAVMDASVRGAISDPSFVAYAGAPLLIGGEVVGVLGIFMKEPARDFEEGDLELLQVVANQIAAGVANHRLYQDLQAQAEQLRDQVTQRQRTETTLARVTAQARCLLWRAAVEERGGALWWDTQLLNPAAAHELLRVEQAPGEALAHAWYRQIPAEERAVMNARSEAAIRSGAADYQQEYSFCQADGGLRWVYEDARIQQVAAGRWEVIGVATDVTERKHLEEQLRQAQRMEAVGQLASGIAHDFNNMLSVINGYADLLGASPELPGAMQIPVQEIRKAGERTASLTQQLLAFSRRQLIMPRVIDLNALITDTERMLRRLIGEDVELVANLSPELHPVRADPGQLHQVLLNLVVNARDAMPRGGRFTVETGNAELAATDFPPDDPGVPGSYVLLTVQDTGSGIDPAVLPLIFEPFFTTKGVGRGTGLGLATVYGIIRQAEGRILVDSQPGQGTTFRVFLPAAAAAAEGPVMGDPDPGDEGPLTRPSSG
jgi:signal transduction histidine kinase